MPPDIELVSRRLTLRILRQEDSDAFSRCVSQSESLHQWIDWCDEQFNLYQAQEFIRANRLNWIKGTSYGFGVFEQDSNSLVGMVAVTEIQVVSNSATLGYWIADHYQQQGFATEALSELIKISFETLGLTRLEIICDPDNFQSHKVALSCRGLSEGLSRNRFIYNGEAKDGMVFSIIPDDIVSNAFP
jgi:RimJ/RimL family protein N-acetyltransferase